MGIMRWALAIRRRGEHVAVVDARRGGHAAVGRCGRGRCRRLMQKRW